MGVSLAFPRMPISLVECPSLFLFPYSTHGNRELAWNVYNNVVCDIPRYFDYVRICVDVPIWISYFVIGVLIPSLA